MACYKACLKMCPLTTDIACFRSCRCSSPDFGMSLNDEVTAGDNIAESSESARTKDSGTGISRLELLRQEL